MQRLSISVVLAAALTTSLHAQQWPTWRGPASSGVSAERGLPVEWSDTERHRLEGVGPGSRDLVADRLERSRSS